MNEQTTNKVIPLMLFKYFVFFIAGACIFTAFVAGENDREVLVGIFCAACLIIVSIPMFVQKRVDLFEPLTFLVLLVTIGIPMKIIYVYWFGRHDQHVIDHVLLQKKPADFLYGSIIVSTALFMLVLGYLLRFPRTTVELLYFPRVKDINGRRLQFVLLIFFVISMIGFAGFAAKGGISLSSLTSLSQKRFGSFREEGAERMHNVLYLFMRMAGFSKFIVYFGLVWLIHRKKSFFSYTGLLVFIAALQTITLGFAINSRAGVALLLLDCCVLCYFLMRQFDARLIFGAGLIGIVLMMVMLAARSKLVDESAETPLAGLVKKTLCGRQFMDIAKISHIIDGVPRKMEYRNGEMLYNWLAGPVPTKYWPDKPMWASQGVKLNQKIFNYKGTVSGCPPGIMGELYWNFGLPGLLIGMFLLGIIYRQMYSVFHPNRHSPAAILIYTMVLTRFFLFTIGNDLGTGIVKSGLDLIPTYMTFMFVGMVSADDPFVDRSYEGLEPVGSL